MTKGISHIGSATTLVMDRLVSGRGELIASTKPPVPTPPKKSPLYIKRESKPDIKLSSLPPLAVVPSAIAGDKRLTRSALAVLVALYARANRRTGQCNPSAATLARDTGIAIRHVREAKRVLEKLGYLKSERQFQRNGREATSSHILISPRVTKSGTGRMTSSVIPEGDKICQPNIEGMNTEAVTNSVGACFSAQEKEQLRKWALQAVSADATRMGRPIEKTTVSRAISAAQSGVVKMVGDHDHDICALIDAGFLDN